MNNKLDPDTLKIPAYLRKKAIVSQARQKLILTALDRKEAGLSPHSRKALAQIAPRSTLQPNLLALPESRRIPSKTPWRAQAQKAPDFEFSQNLKKFKKTGTITHFLDKISVAIIMLSAPLKTGDHILLEGEDSIFMQTVEEMQIDRKPVTRAKKGDHIGLKSACKAVVNGSVYKV